MAKRRQYTVLQGGARSTRHTLDQKTLAEILTSLELDGVCKGRLVPLLEKPGGGRIDDLHTRLPFETVIRLEPRK